MASLLLRQPITSLGSMPQQSFFIFRGTMLADIRIIGAIDEDTYEAFCIKLDALENMPIKARPKSVAVEITSDGGSAYLALAFVDRMRLSPMKFVTTGVGRVASAATLILAAGDVRRLTQEAWVMVHEDSGEVEGTVSEMEAQIKHLRSMENQWNSLLSQYSRNKSKPAVFAELHKRGDVNLSPTECVALGLVDEII